MSTGLNSVREATVPRASSTVAAAGVESSGNGSHIRSQRSAPRPLRRYASDDEILGINSAATPAAPDAAQIDAESQSSDGGAAGPEFGLGSTDESEHGPSEDTPNPDNSPNDPAVIAALDAHPELRQAWQDAHSYREVFATPEEARAATALLSDLDRMDSLFFSRRPEDHKELARAVASLDPVAFASLAQAMNHVAANPNASISSSAENERQIPHPRSPSAGDRVRDDNAIDASAAGRAAQPSPAPAQVEFLHAANAAAVQGVLDAIETQVDRLLPEGVSKSARNRVVGEIYRELDASLGSNRQLGQQMRDAFRSGNLDSAHQRAVVALVTGRARQALPGIAKRVLNEWTSTVVAANQDRLARQRAAAHRVDISGSGRGGDGGRRSLAPRDLDYSRLSDSDILNL